MWDGPPSDGSSKPVGVKVTLSQQELEGRLWAAANSLRGPVDPSDFKAYIFPLLFYKRVTDAWDDEHARAVADYGADVTPDVEADYHRFQLPEGCHWRDLRKVTDNVGVALQNVLDRIQQSNPDTLAGIFGDVAWGNKDKLPEHALLNLIEAFHTLDLGPSRVGHDVLGNAYEYLLKQFADESGKKAGARGVALFTRSRDGTYTFGEFNGAERKLPKFPSVSPSEAMSFVRATGAVPSGTPELVWAPTDVSGTPFLPLYQVATAQGPRYVSSGGDVLVALPDAE